MSKRRFKSRSRHSAGQAAKRRPRPPHGESHDALPRLQKVLAAAGLGSRRECEQLIVEGRVEVDRRVESELGTRVDPLQQEIRVDGEPLARPRPQHFMLNKPPGVVSTSRDPARRTRVIDLIQSHYRLFPVGRLDLASEGLILVTNDGELANLLTHPRYEVEKTYLAQVVGVPTRDDLAQLERGVHLAEGFAHAKRVRIKAQQKHSALLEIVLDEGRNREVRRLLARTGHKVLRLKRIAVGSLRLGELAPGEYRPLRPEEVRRLKAEALDTSNNQNRDRHSKDRKTGVRAATSSSAAPGAAPPRPPEADEAFDDVFAPRHAGTIIGADDNGQINDDTRGTREQSPTASKRRSQTVKPLIDVRRGIFPRAAGDRGEDSDDDETEIAKPRPQFDFTRRDTLRKQRSGGQRATGRSGQSHLKGREQPKKSGKKHRPPKQPRHIDSQSKHANPRKGRRR